MLFLFNGRTCKETNFFNFIYTTYLKPWPNGVANRSRRKLKTWVYLPVRLTGALRCVPGSISRYICITDWLSSVVKRNAILITNLWFIFKVTSKLKRFPISRIRRKSFNSLEKIRNVTKSWLKWCDQCFSVLINCPYSTHPRPWSKTVVNYCSQ